MQALDSCIQPCSARHGTPLSAVYSSQPAFDHLLFPFAVPLC